VTVPRHPTNMTTRRQTETPLSARTKAIIAGIAVVVVVMIVLHIAGVAPH
jgi:hypothetical protein